MLPFAPFIIITFKHGPSPLPSGPSTLFAFFFFFFLFVNVLCECVFWDGHWYGRTVSFSSLFMLRLALVGGKEDKYIYIYISKDRCSVHAEPCLFSCNEQTKPHSAEGISNESAIMGCSMFFLCSQAQPHARCSNVLPISSNVYSCVCMIRFMFSWTRIH